MPRHDHRFAEHFFNSYRRVFRNRLALLRPRDLVDQFFANPAANLADATRRDAHNHPASLADEIAGAAELVMGKTARIPAAIVRGLSLRGEGNARDLVMPAERDLFR